ncbi:YoqO family protein [Bacillus sp. TL12]|uniref:YoqO family protein n=1 Tax=Bacillus sp. TL12 TaxID=2894756 RepID=UPI001F52132E|nr:YoqO family protein [Bacillus sp. TL12]MCI0764594.1 YoqO family protein [Bacillus sp. TL12]
MKEKIGFYGILTCLIVSIISSRFIESDWIVAMITIVGLIFALLYRWDEWKTYSRKKKLVLSAEFVILVTILPFILMEGGKQMNTMPIFQGWLYIDKSLYSIVVLVVIGIIVTKVNGKLLVNESKT